MPRTDECLPILSLRTMTKAQVRSAVAGFSRRYTQHWMEWQSCGEDERPEAFGKMLRRWQATRPLAMRRTRTTASHGFPFLEDLLSEAAKHLNRTKTLDMRSLQKRTARQSQSLMELWNIFSQLPVNGPASCVGISKAVLLVSNGRIGPAFDSSVRRQLGLRRFVTGEQWIQTLDEVSRDIRAFEMINGEFSLAVPKRFNDLGPGRLYDMVFGPRERR